ncbi:stage III sporulation protein AA [Anaerovorax odorimutans]|uniref:Stage III sporulation protein AA n=1 Tax=Anaerovorax odorimutans TaxID=109327 RepID=A0ABT1RL33_9FIRM|nr:stage III sporulation protein AA [Anaerovorax odorimutans]MCQ4635894.1 stage III sporulation protein AA [Anaerovorax odorimutans]
MNNLEQILNKLPDNIRGPVMDLPETILNNLEEIRIKAENDIRVLAKNQEIVVALKKNALVTRDDLDTILNNLLNYSYYAYEEELAKGYITIEGGHRVGVCGRAVLDKGKVCLIKEISSLNIRRSREIIGVADRVIPHILDKDTGRLANTLIVSPPKCGKTTLLRDIVRVLSYKGYKVGLCDERSEIAGSYLGKPSYDLGPRTDVLDACPKAEGMTMLIRAMSPDVVVTDEIGRTEDIAAIETAICAGVNILTTIHGKSYDDVIASNIGPLAAKGVFSRLVFLTNDPRTGTIEEVLHA